MKKIFLLCTLVSTVVVLDINAMLVPGGNREMVVSKLSGYPIAPDGTVDLTSGDPDCWCVTGLQIVVGGIQFGSNVIQKMSDVTNAGRQVGRVASVFLSGPSVKED